MDLLGPEWMDNKSRLAKCLRLKHVFDTNDLIRLSTLSQIQLSQSLWPWGLKEKHR
jgi:hypothetical protein